MESSSLIFEYSGHEIVAPAEINSTYIQVVVTNMSSERLESLGLYIKAATNIGDIDYPASNPPETDYEDLLTWGTRSSLGIALQGGLKVIVPQNDGTYTGYIDRNHGATYSNKIAFIDMDPGDAITFQIKIETPPGVSTRRFFIDICVEN